VLHFKSNALFNWEILKVFVKDINRKKILRCYIFTWTIRKKKKKKKKKKYVHFILKKKKKKKKKKKSCSLYRKIRDENIKKSKDVIEFYWSNNGKRQGIKGTYLQ